MVELEEYILNHALLDSYNFLLKFLHVKGLYRPEAISKISPKIFSRRTDIKHGIGWALEYKVPLIQLLNKKTDEKIELFSSKDVMDFIGEINSSPLLRCFRANKYARFCK